jgi:hypothetical protein
MDAPPSPPGACVVVPEAEQITTRRRKREKVHINKGKLISLNLLPLVVDVVVVAK